MGFFKKHILATPWQLLRLFIPFTGILPLVVYYLTVFPCVYPGSSAFLTATAAGLCQQDDLAQPIFMLAARGIAALHYGTLPLRLNLFCAACGAVAVSLNGRVAYQFNGIYYQPVFVNGVTQYMTFMP